MTDVQVKAEHYDIQSYDTKDRFISYWHQIHEITVRKPASILEIGVGNRFVSNYLRANGFHIQTLDIDRNLQPDLIGSVLDIPACSGTYDLVACFEVLEHLPYDKFRNALQEIARVSKRHVIISVPDVSRYYHFYLEIPRIGIFKKLIALPRLHPPPHVFDGQHYWELGKQGYSNHRMKQDIAAANLKLVDSYNVYDHPYHHFFCMEKQTA